MIRYFLVAVMVLGFGNAVLRGQEPPEVSAPARTEVILKGQAKPASYNLKIGYTPENAAPPLAALVVETQPSGRVLATLWNSDLDAQRRELKVSPLVESETSFAQVRASFEFVFEPGADDRIVVRAILPNGESRPLMGAKVDLKSFDIQTDFNW